MGLAAGARRAIGTGFSAARSACDQERAGWALWAPECWPLTQIKQARFA